MALVQLFEGFLDAGNPGSFEETVLESSSVVVVRNDSGLFTRLGGEFSFSSESAFFTSVVTSFALTKDQDGNQPLYRISRFRATVTEITNGESSLETILSGNDTVNGSIGADPLVGEFLGAGSDTARGGDGDDVVGGSAGRDKLFGGDGDDLLVSSLLGDTMSGGAGGDTFLFQRGSTGSKILDFSRADGDRLVLSIEDLFGGEDPSGGDVGQFVSLRGTDRSVTLSIDADGGGDRFVKLATIKGDLGTGLEELVSSGVLDFG